MGRRCRLEASACLAWAAMLLVLPLKWLGAAALAALWHELCHYLALWLVGVEVRGIRIGGRGTVMDTGDMLPWQECICALAGPVGGLMLLPLAGWIPRVAVIALVHSVYNLLPVYPLDGGRALRCATGMVLRERTAEKICRGAEMLCAAAILLVGIYCLLRLKTVLCLAAALGMGWHIKQNRQNLSHIPQMQETSSTYYTRQ